MSYWKYFYLKNRKEFWDKEKEGIKEITKFIGGGVFIVMFILGIQLYIIDVIYGLDTFKNNYGINYFSIIWMIGNIIFFTWFLFIWNDYWDYKTKNTNIKKVI